jgi:hypothetical protein
MNASHSLHLIIRMNVRMHSYESPFSKGGFRGIFQVSNASRILRDESPLPPISLGGCKQLYAPLSRCNKSKMSTHFCASVLSVLVAAF